MKPSAFAAIALIVPSSLMAQAAALAADYGAATPLPGNWAYSIAADRSEATFVDASARPQLTIRCARATRRVSVSKPATAAAPFVSIWTSSQSRNAPTGFDPATSRLTADFAAYDSILDAIAFSRGRVAFSVGGGPALVVPAWSEISRVVEDCRS